MKRRRNSQAIPEEIQALIMNENKEDIFHGIFLAESIRIDGDTMIQWMIKQNILNKIGYCSTKLQREIFLLLLEYYPNAQYFQSVKRLDLPSIDLYQIPDEIGYLTNLEWLNLSYNNLTYLPDSIGNLKNLEELYLPYNELTELPDSIGNLMKLQFLGIGQNKLSEVPDSIGNLQNLKMLDLSYNNLSYKEEKRIPQLLPNTNIYL